MDNLKIQLSRILSEILVEAKKDVYWLLDINQDEVCVSECEFFRESKCAGDSVQCKTRDYFDFKKTI